MCTYTGGKARIGKKIFDAIVAYELELNGNNNCPYMEPFVGMGGVLFHFAKNQSREIIACDYQKCIISFWQEIQAGWLPCAISKEQYDIIKKSDKHDAEYAFAAYGCSFMGAIWKMYYPDFMERAIKRIHKKNYKTIMERVFFLDHRSYIEHNPKGMLIYCDPPYSNSKFDIRVSNLYDFDYSVFWETMRKWSTKNIVIISERSAPDDFKSIYSFERGNPFNKKKVITEHLFVYNSKKD